MRYTDRSRIVQDWKCPRSRYWQYEYNGHGIVSTTTSLELGMGTVLHEALAEVALQHIAGGVQVDAIAEVARDKMRDGLLDASDGELDGDARTFANEQAALVEGIVRGFCRHAWPRLMQGRKIVSVEPEMIYPISDTLQFMSKPDLITESEEDGEWEYIEYKSTSSKKQSWLDSWNTAVQLHSSVKAVENTLGRAPSRVIVQGLYKGFESYGKQNSPFCYAYVKSGNPPFTQDQVQYDYKAGFRRQPTWERPGGVKQWVDEMPNEILANQFPQTPPIFIKEGLVRDFFVQTLEREGRIAPAIAIISGPMEDDSAKMLDRAFPQHFEQCTPAWGRPCPYRMLCHGHVSEPLEVGFQVREPHHTTEAEA